MFLLQLDGNLTPHRALCSPKLSIFSISPPSSVAEPVTPTMSVTARHRKGPPSQKMVTCNTCHQMASLASTLYKIQFRTPLGELTTLPQTP